jgi:hypothetical protein
MPWSSDDGEDGIGEHQQQQSGTTAAPRRQAKRRVDNILARLHDSSWEALSPEDVAILQRASQRYRRRRGTSQDS